MSAAVPAPPVAVVYNVDFSTDEAGGDASDDPPSCAGGGPLRTYEANADVTEVASAIASALVRRGVDVLRVGVSDGPVEVVARLRGMGVGRVFNLVESLGGDSAREPELPRLLGEADIAFTGNGPRALTLAADKHIVRALLSAHGIPVAAGLTISDRDHLPAPQRLASLLPAIVKPSCADGSIGVAQASVVTTVEALYERAAWLLAACGPCVVERYLPGAEVNVALIPSDDGFLGVATTICFDALPGGLWPIVTYDGKWASSSVEYVTYSVPARERLPAGLIAACVSTARAAALVCGCDGYTRVDLRLDASDRPIVIDVNPNPDLHPEAGFAIAARSLGLDYEALVQLLLHHAHRGGRHVRPADDRRRSRAARLTAATC